MATIFLSLSVIPRLFLVRSSTEHRTQFPKCLLPLSSNTFPSVVLTRRRRNDFTVRSDDGDVDSGDPDDYDVDEELDNKKDYDVEYEPSLLTSMEDVAIAQTMNLVSKKGWEEEKFMDYRINEDEFHKISLFHCDFFIRKPPDPDSDVYDFGEMYVTPPDTDIYAIPKILAPMPKKTIRCAMSDFGSYNVTEPPIDAPRDPLYKSEREIQKVFLTKHYRNRRTSDPEFVLDFEEIYVIDSSTKSISRAKVLVTIKGGRNRDRKNDLLTIRDSGNSFKIIDKSLRKDPTAVIETKEWLESRKEMEKHLSKLRDFPVSNWF
ncbi:plastid transcriptionally active 6 [Zostera marina]|uniref:Plastid transcriptionally active 6 n=1 Tax=Zostera marina TaxID=29655 RepID=A0A0K9PEK7_ZOSMR|nr:plastid transcriptionally active 6 [Zostera marina]